jgi:hypothetical protein
MEQQLLLADASRGLEALPLPAEAPPEGPDGAAAAVERLRTFLYIADADAPASTLTSDAGARAHDLPSRTVRSKVGCRGPPTARRRPLFRRLRMRAVQR